MTTPTPIVIRRAVPEDRAFLAWSILTTTRSHLSRGWFDIALDRPETDCLQFLTQLTTAAARSPWHYSRFLVASEGASSQPLAALSAVPAHDGYKDVGLALLLCLKKQGLSQGEIERFWERSAYLHKCVPQPDKKSLVTEVGATAPNGRGKGYMAALFERLIDDARSQGFKRIETSCFIGNIVSERMHIRLGFSCVGELRDPDFEAIAGAPGMLRLMMEL